MLINNVASTAVVKMVVLKTVMTMTMTTTMTRTPSIVKGNKSLRIKSFGLV